MRLSSLSLAAVLLFSSLAFAQHQNAPPPPPPAPPPSPAAAPNPVPGFTPSAPALAPESHVSAPAPAPAASPAPAAAAVQNEPSIPNPAAASSAAHAPEPGRLVPDQKIAGDEKIQSVPRVGEDLRAKAPVDKNSPDKEKDAKAEPDLRRHLCGDKPCESPEPKPIDSDKERKRPCVKEPCPCPPGQKTNAGGCVATMAQNECPAGQIWNGGACIAQTCPPNQVWNGISCVSNRGECLAIEGRAAPMIRRLRDLRARMEEACMQNPSGQQCMDLTEQHRILLEEYRALWLEASPVCRSQLPDPASL